QIMKKQNEQRLEPKLRFKGFTDDWEQCKLGELGKDYSGLTGKTKKDFGHGESLYVPYKNIFNNHIVDVDNLEKVNVSSKQNKVKYGDIFFTISSEVPEEVGMSSVMRKDINNLYLNSFSFGLRPYENSELDMIFSSYLFRTLTFRKKMYILAQGISRYNISKANVMKLEIALPSVNEQKKIGRLLYKLDSMITLHNKKLKFLKKLENAYSVCLFDFKNSAPLVRFSNFNNDWEMFKVKDLFTVTRGQVLSVDNISKFKTDNNKFPVYSSQTHNNGLLGYYHDFLFDTAITWTTDGANAGTVKFRSGNFYSTNVNGVLISDDGYACEAVAKIIEKETPRWVVRVGNPKLMNNVMSDITIKISSDVNELEKISSILVKLNTRI